MMDIHEPAQEFRHLGVKSTPAPALSDDDEEMVLNYSDSEDDHSSKVSKNENFKDALDLFDKDSQMEATDQDVPDKKHNGTETLNETGGVDKQNDENSAAESEYFPTVQNEEVEKLSLLDRFLSSEVVDNGKEIVTELIGDELVDEVANEVIDENALLDEIANDLDQEDLDEDCLLEDEIAEIEANDSVAVNCTEANDSKPGSDSTVEQKPDEEKNEETAESGSYEMKPVIEDNDEAPKVEPMDIDDCEPIETVAKPKSTEAETTKSEVNENSEETGVDNTDTDGTAIETKVDEDNDNNLLEEMLDSPRSSEHGSMSSEKDDTTTRDSNDEPQSTVQSSNENSNMSDAMTEHTSGVVDEFKHDQDLDIMDDASANDDVDTKPTKNILREAKLEIEEDFDGDASLKKEIKEEASADEPVDTTSNDAAESLNYAAQSPEPPCKRKMDEEIEEPENKKKRVEEEPITAERAGSAENAVSSDNDTNIADQKDDDEMMASTTGDNVEKEVNDTNKEDDDDVLIVGETKQTAKPADAESSTETNDIQAPVQKAKILILDTQAIEKDLREDAGDKTSDKSSVPVPEGEPEVSSSQDDPVVEKQSETETETETETQTPAEEVDKETPVVTRVKSPPTLTLDPAPQKTLCPTAFSLNFVRKFQKNFDKMSRDDLEELLIQKCIEVIVHKSDYADMRNKIEKQESKLQSYSTKYQELSKQYRDLEMVHQRVIKDLEIKNQSVVTPVKITRAVGLQVSLPRKEISVQKPPPPAAMNSPQSIAAQQNAALAAKNRRKVLPQRPNDPNVSVQQQQQILRNNMMMQHQRQMQQQRLQQQQQQGQNNLLKQQLIQNNSPTNLRQQANIRKPVSQFSPVAGNQMQNTSPKTPVSANQQRVPPVILKKMTPTRTVNNPSGSNATAVYSSQSKIANTSITRTSINNLIDLTEEEDSRRVAQNGTNPPALVAIPNNQGNKTVVGQGKVSFVTLKPGTPQAQQQQLLQQNRLAMHKVGGAYVPIAPKANGTTGQIVQLRKQPATTLTVPRRQHPAPLPYPNNQPTNPYWKLIPPRPIIRINNIEAGIVISWTMDEMTDKHAEVASYQIYAYQETSAAPSPETWRHVGDVKAMLLPMAVTLTQFQEGQRYHFAVRAVDEHSRYGIFSLPKTWT